jgi:capsid protein
MDIQSWFIDAFLEKLYPVWVQMSALSGKVKVPYEEIDRYIAPEWQPRRWDWVDPLKDVQAKIMELKNGLTTRTRICAEQGIDFEDILEEIKREKQLMDKYGVTIQDIDKDTALITEGNEEVLTGGNNNGNQGK